MGKLLHHQQPWPCCCRWPIRALLEKVFTLVNMVVCTTIKCKLQSASCITLVHVLSPFYGTLMDDGSRMMHCVFSKICKCNCNLQEELARSRAKTNRGDHTQWISCSWFIHQLSATRVCIFFSATICQKPLYVIVNPSSNSF